LKATAGDVCLMLQPHHFRFQIENDAGVNVRVVLHLIPENLKSTI
jgi:hypothetical protein